MRYVKDFGAVVDCAGNRSHSVPGCEVREEQGHASALNRHLTIQTYHYLGSAFQIDRIFPVLFVW